MDIIHKVTNPEGNGSSISECQLSDQIFMTALKLIHKAGKEGTVQQKSELLKVRHEIVALNILLSKGREAIVSQVQRTCGIQLEQAQELENIQIAPPQTKFEKMIEVATLIPRVIFSIIIDIAFLPLAGGLLLYMLTKPNFDPLHPKQNAVPILLLHGSGFNESEWILGRQFLKKQQYGSVFSLNYDGLVSNDPKKGIEDYAQTKVRAKILEIKEKTGQNEIILIGHSRGGGDCRLLCTRLYCSRWSCH